MQTLRRTCSTGLVVLACVALAPDAGAQPRDRPKVATLADVERLEQRIEAQQQLLDRLIALHRQYLQSVSALVEGTSPPPVVDDQPAGQVAVDKPAVQPAGAPGDRPAPPTVATTPASPTVATTPAPPPVAIRPPPRAGATRTSTATAPRPRGSGTLVGKVTGAPGAVIYLEDIVVNGHGTAEMKQEGKAFLPRVLVVQKGTKVGFPNRDAIFHNVFSVSPDNTFDLGSYPQGQSRTVTMSRAGVVTVYCNMHPQMVGYILVVPNGNYARAGGDGFFRLTNVPAGAHRVVVWAPNAKPARVQATVGEDEVVTIDVSLTRTKSSIHTKSNGLPYGSYEQ